MFKQFVIDNNTYATVEDVMKAVVLDDYSLRNRTSHDYYADELIEMFDNENSTYEILDNFYSPYEIAHIMCPSSYEEWQDKVLCDCADELESLLRDMIDEDENNENTFDNILVCIGEIRAEFYEEKVTKEVYVGMYLRRNQVYASKQFNTMEDMFKWQTEYTKTILDIINVKVSDDCTDEQREIVVENMGFQFDFVRAEVEIPSAEDM